MVKGQRCRTLLREKASRFSSSTTWAPSSASSMAARSPQGPAPTTRHCEGDGRREGDGHPATSKALGKSPGSSAPPQAQHLPPSLGQDLALPTIPLFPRGLQALLLPAKRGTLWGVPTSPAA